MRLSLFPLVSVALAASVWESISQLQQTLAPKAAEHELISLHKSLVDINSITGHEQKVAHFLKEYLEKSGFTVEIQIVEQGRQNIYAYFGERRNTTVLLTSHIDTVPPYIPYYVSGDRIYGRGSNDAKGSVATQILATKSLYEAGEISEGDVSLLFVVGEEYDGAGMVYANKHLDATWDHAVFGEPTELKLGVGHKGVYHFDINVEGKASHSGYPHLGIDANKKLIDILYRIEHAEYPTDPLLGNTSVNVGLIDAGVAGNVVSPRAFAKLLIRVANSAEGVKKIIGCIIDEANRDYENVKVTDFQVKEPVYLNYEVPGFDSIVLAYFTDVPNLVRPFKSRYLYGPGSILVAHSADEYVTLSDLKGALEGYKKLTKYLLAQ
jgi:acetylornithine deacetylase